MKKKGAEMTTTRTTAIGPDSTVHVAKDQVSCDLGGESAILNLSNGVYYGLDPLGARIWELVQRPRTVRQVKESILEEYEVSPDVCERDLLTLLTHLSKEGLIEVENAQAA
jgi:hypothetical protein